MTHTHQIITYITQLDKIIQNMVCICKIFRRSAMTTKCDNPLGVHYRIMAKDHNMWPFVP